MTIECTETRYPNDLFLLGRYAAAFVAYHWHLDAPRPGAEMALGVHLPVVVNASRWIVQCPCGSAQLASKTDHRFFCVDCNGREHGGAWASTDWPDDADDIEAALDVRIDRATRNWAPPETVDDLLAENAEHGLDVVRIGG